MINTRYFLIIPLIAFIIIFKIVNCFNPKEKNTAFDRKHNLPSDASLFKNAGKNSNDCIIIIRGELDSNGKIKYTKKLDCEKPSISGDQYQK